MHTKIIELTNNVNWGKFMLARFSASDWTRRSAIGDSDPRFRLVPLLVRNGWTPDFVWVLDLQTGEGALFYPAGNARADLEKHSIHVCPMFPFFLDWFYRHPEHWGLEGLPPLITLTDEESQAASALYGRRYGSRRQA